MDEENERMLNYNIIIISERKILQVSRFLYELFLIKIWSS